MIYTQEWKISFPGGLSDSLLLFSITNTTFHFFILMSQFREPLDSWSFPFRLMKKILSATLINYSAAIELNILDKISTVERERTRKNSCQLYFPCWRSKTPDSNKSFNWEWNDTSYESYSSPKWNIFALGIRGTLFLKKLEQQWICLQKPIAILQPDDLLSRTLTLKSWQCLRPLILL